MLTTVDNPYSPFDEFDKWLAYDVSHGYDCCGLVDRLTHVSNSFSESWNARDIESAIDEFVLIDPLKFYVKVEKKNDGGLS